MAGVEPRLYSVTVEACQRVRVPFALVLAAMLAGCGSMGRLDGEATGSIAPPPATVPAAAAAPAPPARATEPSTEASDWEAVRRSVAKASATRKPAGKIAWTNDQTGNSGTISDVIASARAGQACRNFNTTVASVGGVRLYRAELCRGSRDTWDYVTVEPADGKAAGRDPG